MAEDLEHALRRAVEVNGHRERGPGVGEKQGFTFLRLAHGAVGNLPDFERRGAMAIYAGQVVLPVQLMEEILK